MDESCYMVRDAPWHRRRVTRAACFSCQREFICTYSPPNAFWVITAERLQTTTVAVKSPMFSNLVSRAERRRKCIHAFKQVFRSPRAHALIALSRVVAKPESSFFLLTIVKWCSICFRNQSQTTSSRKVSTLQNSSSACLSVLSW